MYLSLTCEKEMGKVCYYLKMGFRSHFRIKYFCSSGESAVGKSSLVLRFVKGQFHEFQESTIGAAFLTQTVCLDDTTVKFEIW